MRLQVTVQLFDRPADGPDEVMWGYHHDEIVFPVEGGTMEDGLVAVARQVLDRLDEAKGSISGQIAFTGGALREGDDDGRG
jgi:hypothetical protein